MAEDKKSRMSTIARTVLIALGVSTALVGCTAPRQPVTNNQTDVAAEQTVDGSACRVIDKSDPSYAGVIYDFKESFIGYAGGFGNMSTSFTVPFNDVVTKGQQERVMAKYNILKANGGVNCDAPVFSKTLDAPRL